MAFGDLTTGRKSDYTQSSNTGMNLLRQNFGKFSFVTKPTAAIMPSQAEEQLGVNLKKEGGVEVLS